MANAPIYINNAMVMKRVETVGCGLAGKSRLLLPLVSEISPENGLLCRAMPGYIAKEICLPFVFD